MEYEAEDGTVEDCLKKKAGSSTGFGLNAGLYDLGRHTKQDSIDLAVASGPLDVLLRRIAAGKSEQKIS